MVDLLSVLIKQMTFIDVPLIECLGLITLCAINDQNFEKRNEIILYSHLGGSN